MQSTTQDTSAPALTPTPPKERGEEDTIIEHDAVNTTPKDTRFWLVMVGLLFATFISAVDLTGKFISFLIHRQLCLVAVFFSFFLSKP